MSTTEKFSSKLDSAVLSELRTYSKHSKRPISALLSEAVSEYLAKVNLRPAFRDAATSVMDEHSELLERLAK